MQRDSAEPRALCLLRKFILYETRGKYWLIGRTKDRKQWRVLKLSRLEANDLDVTEDPVIYTERECARLLAGIEAGHVHEGGSQLILQVLLPPCKCATRKSCSVLLPMLLLKRALGELVDFLLRALEHRKQLCAPQADAVLGCFKFLEGYYLLFATEKRLQGNICGKVALAAASCVRIEAMLSRMRLSRFQLLCINLIYPNRLAA